MFMKSGIFNFYTNTYVIFSKIFNFNIRSLLILSSVNFQVNLKIKKMKFNLINLVYLMGTLTALQGDNEDSFKTGQFQFKKNSISLKLSIGMETIGH